jgi:hypothetical protein
MPAILNRSSQTQLSDGIISFLQYLFKTPEITPAGYRWNSDERQTQIFIGGPFSVTREKVGQLPTITVIRSPFQSKNMVVNHLQSASPNTFENPISIDIIQGMLSIVCECGAGDEAEALAQFIMLEMQANRRELIKEMPFVHRFLGVSVGVETPVKEAAEIERWQAVVSIDVSLYMGWLKFETGLNKFNKAALFNAQDFWESDYGSFETGSAIITDDSADFGFLTANNPRLLEAEFNKRWYYVLADGRKLTVEEIISNKKLRLSVVDADGAIVPFASQETKKINYKLVWNTVHVYTEFKTKE